MSDTEELAKRLEDHPLWEEFLIAAKSSGENGEIELFDIDDMHDAAWNILTTLAAEVEALRKRLGPEIETPIEPGGFVGDIFFGHPDKTTMGTHRWNGAEWEELPTELEAALSLLAEARKRLDEAREAIADAVGALDGAGAELSEFANILSRDPIEANHTYHAARDAQDALARIDAKPVKKTDDDLIRRGDALKVIDPGYGDFHAGHYNAIASLPALARIDAKPEAPCDCAFMHAQVKALTDALHSVAPPEPGLLRNQIDRIKKEASHE